MADFDVPDYSGVAGLGAGIQGFAKGLMDMENHKYQKLEMEAKAKAREDEKRRQKFQDALELRSKGFQVPEGDLYSMDPSSLQYDPEYLKMKTRERAAAADPYGLKGLKREQELLDLDKKKAESEFASIGKDKQVQVEKLSGSLASRKTIKNDIDSALGQLEDPSITADEKLLVGRELLKTLNSSQGADAIGTEEAKRLGSLLEFKILPRIGEPGNMFGRDIPMFVQQVRNNSDRLGQSIDTTQAQIDDLFGRGQTVGKLPRGRLKEPGLLQRGAEAMVPKAAASNKVKISNGKETLLIEPKDLAAAQRDGFKRVP